MMADAGAPAFSAGGPASPSPSQPTPTGQPSGAIPPGAPVQRSRGYWRLISAGAVVVLVVVAIVFLSGLVLSGSITASDGSFSVKNPGEWYPTTFSFVDGRRIVLAIETGKGGGKSDLGVADYGQQIPLDLIPAAWEQMAASGQLQDQMRLGGLGPTTVGGAPAMAGDVQAEKDGVAYSGQLIFIDYNNTTYIVAIVSSDYSRMHGDFQTLLSSWKWLR